MGGGGHLWVLVIDGSESQLAYNMHGFIISINLLTNNEDFQVAVLTEQ